MDADPVQLRREQLTSMSSAEIVAAHHAGQLDAISRGETPDHVETQEAERLVREIDLEQAQARGETPAAITRDDLKTMRSSEIVRAQREGRLDHLLAR